MSELDGSFVLMVLIFIALSFFLWEKDQYPDEHKKKSEDD